MIGMDPWAVVWYSLGLILALILLVVLVMIIAALTISVSRWLKNALPVSKRKARRVKHLQLKGQAKAARYGEIKYRQEFSRRGLADAFSEGAEWGIKFALTEKDQ